MPTPKTRTGSTRPRPDLGGVPLAVWPCVPLTPDPPGPAAAMPPLLARRLIAAYTRHGEVVLAAGAGASVVAEAAAAAGRHPVLDDADPPRVFPPLGAARAALIVATAPAVTLQPARYARWAHALAPGGLLAAVLPPGIGPAALRPGQVTAAAQAAGLGYLQHIVAVTARLHGDRLWPVPTPAQLARARAARDAGLPVHLPVHADVIVLIHTPTHRVGSAPAAPTQQRGTGTAEAVSADAHAA